MNEPFRKPIRGVDLVDATFLERFFRKPGGRRYLENLTLILINTLPHSYSEKKALYTDFIAVLDDMEQHIRQKEGQEILDGIFRNT